MPKNSGITRFKYSFKVDGKILGGHNDCTFNKWKQKVILISHVNPSLSFAFILSNIVLTLVPMEALPIFSQNVDRFCQYYIKKDI